MAMITVLDPQGTPTLVVDPLAVDLITVGGARSNGVIPIAKDNVTVYLSSGLSTTIGFESPAQVAEFIREVNKQKNEHDNA